MQGLLRRLPCLGVGWQGGWERVWAGFRAETYSICDEVIVKGHPLRDEHISYLRDGVSVYDFLIDAFRGPSRAAP